MILSVWPKAEIANSASATRDESRKARTLLLVTIFLQKFSAYERRGDLSQSPASINPFIRVAEEKI